MITTNMPTLQIHKLTEEQYEAAKLAGALEENALYMTPDEKIPNPDWNQNDETAADYIKNRPFYEESVIVINEQTVTIDTDRSYVTIELDKNSLLPYGGTFIVTFDGVDYKCIGKSWDYRVTACGNATIKSSQLNPESWPNTGEPFFLLDDEGAAGVEIYAEKAGTHTIKVVQQIDIKTIDPKYLPEMSELPAVTADDAGRVLTVNNEGSWYVGVPTLSATDDGNGNITIIVGIVPPPVIISFTLDGVTGQAEEGMTWSQWCDSKYNTSGYYIDEYEAVCGPSNSSSFCEQISDVNGVDIIENGQAYTVFRAPLT